MRLLVYRHNMERAGYSETIDRADWLTLGRRWVPRVRRALLTLRWGRTLAGRGRVILTEKV
jgi:hypothetical protein